MEMAMTNGFAELSVNEMLEVDGGKWNWWDIPLSLAFPVYGVGKIIYEDLSNCYNNGYAEGKALNK